MAYHDSYWLAVAAAMISLSGEENFFPTWVVTTLLMIGLFLALAIVIFDAVLKYRLKYG